MYDINKIKKVDDAIVSSIKGPSRTPTSKYSISQNSKNVNYVNTDNKGRQLSQEQQEYFKDSKVRDEDGNLLTMYHGTDADFNIFTYDNLGKTGKGYGTGLYFTDSLEGAQSFDYTINKNTREV